MLPSGQVILAQIVTPVASHMDTNTARAPPVTYFSEELTQAVRVVIAEAASIPLNLDKTRNIKDAAAREAAIQKIFAEGRPGVEAVAIVIRNRALAADTQGFGGNTVAAVLNAKQFDCLRPGDGTYNHFSSRQALNEYERKIWMKYRVL